MARRIIVASRLHSRIAFCALNFYIKLQNKISKLIKSIEETPYEGLGKPEGLKYHHSGKWSRRITKADRLIYEIEDNKVFIYSLRGHYDK